MKPRFAHAHEAALYLLRNAPREVTADETLEDPSMRRDPLSRRQNREERGRHPGDSFQHLRGHRTSPAVALRLLTHRVEKVSLLTVVVADTRLVGQELVKTRNLAAELKHRLTLTPNRIRIRLGQSRPRELIRIEHGKGRNRRVPNHETLAPPNQLPKKGSSPCRDAAAENQPTRHVPKRLPEP